MVNLKLSIKPFINSYMLPCACEEEEWKTYLKKFNERLQAEPKQEINVEKGILYLRSDGMALLEGSVNKEFAISRSGVKALAMREKLSEQNLKQNEIVDRIAKEFEVSTYQVQDFLNRVAKWVGDVKYEFIEGPTTRKGNWLDIPLLVQWEITAKCNLKCVHCYVDTNGEVANGESDTEEAILLIRDLANYGALCGFYY